VAPKFGDSLYIYGLIALSQGFILTGFSCRRFAFFVLSASSSKPLPGVPLPLYYPILGLSMPSH
jgi:hypothetical protein